MTLSLSKKSKGIYEVENNTILIQVSNPFSALGVGTNGWQIVIEDKVNNDCLASEWFDTKKDAIKFGTSFVLNNL